jgi:hypothetical protein
MSLAEAEEMRAAADRADRLLSICLQCRHWEEFLHSPTYLSPLSKVQAPTHLWKTPELGH